MISRFSVYRAIAALSILAMTLAACQPATAPAPASQAVVPPTAVPPPQELKVGLPRLLANLDPASTAGAYQGIKNALFDTITFVDPQGKLVPWLATSWKSIDATTWEFKLRDNVKFSNGEKLDAAAVKYNIERTINPANKLALAGRIPLVTGATVVDPTTVRFTTRNADAILPSRMAAIFIVAPGEMEKLGPQQFGVKPVGSGPFRLTEFVPESRAVFTRFEESWRKSKIEKLTLLQLDTPSTRIAALRTGEVQIIQDVPLDQLDALQKDGLIVASTTYARLHVIDFDQITEDTPLRDKRVRQALNYAVDKETILKKIYAGQGRVADGQMVGPVGFGYDSALKPIPYDPAQAKKLLAEAGYPNGFTIQMETQQDAKDEGLAIQGYLRDVGVTAEFQAPELSVWLDHFYGRAKRASLFHWKPNYFPAMDADFTLQWYVCNSGKKVYCNPDYDKLYLASAVETDSAKRLDIIKQMHKIIREDLPALFIIEPNVIWARSKRVQNFAPRSDGEALYEDLSLTN